MIKSRKSFNPINHGSDLFALAMAADTGPSLMPVQYERTARTEGNAMIVIRRLVN